MLQTIPWKLPGHAQQLDINDVIHSTAILNQIKRIEEQYRDSEFRHPPRPLLVRIDQRHQHDQGRVLQ